MSIAAVMMARAMGMQHYSAYNAFRTMDNKMALANSVSFGSGMTEAQYRALANKDLQYDISLQKDSLNYQVSKQMYDQAKRLQNDWAKSFSIFA